MVGVAKGQQMTRDLLMTHVRFAVDGYVLGKWSLYQAGAQMGEAMQMYFADHPDELVRAT